MNQKKEETEVYSRIEYLQPGKYYYTTTYTGIEENGMWCYGNHRFFTTNPLKYVGRFLEKKEPGILLFMDEDGKEKEVEYGYRNFRTCFLEADPPSVYVLK